MSRSFLVVASTFLVALFCTAVHAANVSGNVSSPFGPVVDTEVLVADSGGNFVVNAYTDGAGNYSLDLPGDGDFWFFTPQWNLSDYRLLPEVHPDTYCLNCDPVATGSPVNVTAGVPDTGTVDFFLDEGVWFSGHISETGNPGLDLYPVEVQLLTEFTGDAIAGTVNEPDGNYYLPAQLPGRYKLLFRIVPDPFMDGYLGELYDEIPCQSGVQCDLTTEGFVFDLTTGMTVDEDLTRGFLISGLLTNDFGEPLPWAVVDLYDSSGNFVGQTNPGDDHDWGIGVAASDDYYALTPDWSVNGFTPEVYNNLDCFGCDPLAVGDAITVSGGDVGGIDFQLSGGFNISGNVQDNMGGNLQDVEVCAVKRSSGLYLGCSVTDASGNYDIGGLQNIPGDITAIINDTGPHAVVREMWDNQPCCDFNQADVIDMSGGSVGGINFVLDPAAIFSGVIEEEGSPGIPVHPVDIILLDLAGNWVEATTTQPDGSYQMPPVALGDYRMMFEAYAGASAYVDEVYNDHPCPNGNCDANAIGDVITAVAGSNVIDAQLALGFLISGNIQDGGGSPIPGAAVDIHDEFGNHLGTVGTDSGTGDWEFTVQSSGTYYANVPDWSIPGYVPEVWDDHPCGNCDLFAVADPIVVSGANVGGINFVLEPGFQIHFLIGDEFGFPIGEGYVEIFDAVGNHLETAWNNGDGTAQSSLLPNGTYYAYAYGEDWNRTSQLFDGIACPFGTCDVTTGTPITISGADEGPHEFELAWRSEDWTISGHIWDAGGNPTVGGAVELFNQIGQHMGDFWVDGDGYFETWFLPDGTYYARTRYTWETLDEAWDDSLCLNQTCDPTAADPIVVSGGNVTGIDFFLDPIPGGGRIEGVLLDGGGAPVAHAGVVVFNNQGNYLTEVDTDASGFFSTQLLANDNYFARTTREPGGLGRELWVATEDTGNPNLNVYCPHPQWDCDHPPFVSTNGTPITINNADATGVDFVLQIPAGGQIRGQIFDQVIWDQYSIVFPLIEVDLALLQADGFGNWNHIGNQQPDRNGDYNFSGLPDGDYKIFTQWIGWPGFDPECYGGQFCEWGVDFDDPSHGDVINISGGSIFDPADIGLDYTGNRIVGTVTRTDTGEPVSSDNGYVGVRLFDDAGNWTDETGTNSIGQYFFEQGPNQWMLSTAHDTEVFNLTNEVWDNHPCYDDCTPDNMEHDVINFGGGTFLANFALDPATIISGRVTAANGGAPIANIEICSSRQSDGGWTGCGWTDINGDYEIKGLEPRTDYEVFTNNLNGQPFQPGSYPGLADTTSGVALNIDFALEDAFSIFGTITEAGGGGIEGVAACLFDADANWQGNCAGSDASGNYQIGGLYPGDYIVAVFPSGYRRQVYDSQECINNFCDFAAGTLIPVGNPGDAFGIDFALTPTATITGTISNTGGLLTNGNGRARISDPSGNTLMQVGTDGNGEYRAEGLEPGTYYVLGVGRDSNHIDEIWAGDVNLDVYCPRLSCDEATVGTPIVITGTETVSNIDFILQAGSRLNGFITIEGQPAGTSINFYDSAGNYAGFAFSDGAGYFESFSGFPAGTWYLSNRFVVEGIEQNTNQEFMPTMYADGGNPPDNSVDCGFPCNIAATIPSATGIGTDGSTDNSLPSTYNYVFQPDASISGTLLANDLSQVGGAVRVFDSSGNNFTDAWTQDEFGNWNSGPLSAGTYYLVTGYTWADVVDDAWDGANGSPCLNLTCDILATTPVVIQGGVDVSGIDFRLDPIVGGGHIQGSLDDDLGNPVPFAGVVIFNNQGQYLTEVGTDANGNFSTPLLANDDYYIRTNREPGGLGRELFVAPETQGTPGLNVVCAFPAWDCDNPPFITVNGTPITISDADFVDANFVLSVPPGGQIRGHVFDQAIFDLPGGDFPLYEVNLSLLMDDGFGNFDHVADVQSDRDGNYAFSGLPDGNYKLFTSWIPWPGYDPECYGGQYCEWGVDFNDPANGDVIPISGGSIFDPADIGLDPNTDRIVGTVTRTDTGEPVSSNDGYFSVDIYDEVGNGGGGTGTNAIGQYFHLVGPNIHMLSTSHDTQSHNLINKAWTSGGGVPCFDECTPHIAGGEQINFGGGTFLANFALDPATIISGRVTAAVGGAGIANIEICSSRQSDGGWTGCGWTDGNGDYEIKGLEPRNDYEVFTNNLNGQPFQPGSYPGLADTTSGVANGIDFALDPAYSISGRVTDAATTNPVAGQLVCLGQASGGIVNPPGCTATGGNGDYSLGGLNEGSQYIVFVLGRTTPYRSQMWMGVDCPFNFCDFSLGNPIEVGLVAGDATDIDFALQPNTVISGTISRDDDGVGPGPAVPDDFARARLYRASDGLILGTANTNANGEWGFGSLLPDDYYIVSTTRFGNYIDEVYDDVACPRLSCDLMQPGVQLITVSDGDVVPNIDATLVPGSRLSGWLTADGGPLANGVVFIYTPTGAYAGFGSADENGYWESGSGLPAGDYYVSTRWDGDPGANADYFPLVWPNRPCGDPCDLTQGDLITVNGTDDVGDINFDLHSHGGGSMVLLAGQVTDDLGTPLAGVQVDVLDAAGNGVGSMSTDATGHWSVAVATGQSYFALTADWSTGNYIPEVWDDVPCNACDVIAVGTAIVVGTDNVLGIDFELATGNRLSGTVTDEFDSTPLQNVTVCAARLDTFAWIGCSTTDVAGYYEFNGIEPRDDIVPFTWDLDGQLYVPEVHLEKTCCQYWFGDPVTALLTGDATVDFALARSASLSGNVADAATLMGIPGVELGLYDEQCQFKATAQTDVNGDFTITGFVGGIYRLFADASSIGYIRELYPDVKTYFACGDEFGDATPLVIADEEIATGVDMDLDIGGIISGFVSDASGILPFNQGRARLYTPEGDQLLVVGNRESDLSYLIGGVRPGTFHVVLTSNNLGLVDEVYDDVPCPRFSCGPDLAVPIVVGPGDVITNIDAILEPGSLLSGMLTDAGTGLPLANYSVAVYTESGKYASFGVSDATGAWHSWTGLPAGNYIVSNQFRIVDQFQAVEGGYLPMVYPNLTCGEPCDFLLGTTVTVDGTPAGSVGGIDFAMETGASITGSVSAGGSPLAGVSVQLRNSTNGSVIRTVLTDAAGLYSIDGVGSGNYFLRTSNGLGYEDQLYNGISCNPFCDPLSGNAVTVLPTDTTVGPFNFSLVTTPTISGTVTDDLGAPVGGVDVIAYDALGTQVGMDTSDAAGDYLIAGLYAGDFYVATNNSAGYVDALYNGGSCLPGCDPTNGDAVTLTPGGAETGIDLELGSASVISGNVSDGAGNIAGVTVEVYRDTGAFVASATSGGGGNYSVGGLAAGDYHVVTKNTFGYVDEGAGGEVCQTTCAPTSTTVVTVGTNVTVPLNFTLDWGGEISGTVTDTGLNPLQSVTVRVYNAAGTLISSSTTGPAGTYTINGLADGNVFLRTSNSSGYLNQRYDGLDCDALCDVLAGTPVAMTVGAMISGIDFALPLGGSIAGVVTNASAAGIGGVQVQVYDAAGLLAGFAVTAGNGSYTVNGLEDGDYRLKTVNASGYVDLVRGGDNCSPEPCDIFSGVHTTVASSDETGVDMTLQLGDQIAGIATDGMGVPLPSGTAQVYSATGQLVKEGGIFSGSFVVNGLANGTYHMLILNGSGLVDQLWQSMACPGGSCDVTTGTPIVLSGAAVQSDSSPLAGSMRKRYKILSHGSGVHLNFALQRGTRLRGSVSNASGGAVKFATVYFFNSAGVLAGQATTDGLGNFVSPSSFPDGTYFAATSAPGKGGVGGGLIDEIYDDVACAGECSPATQAGTPIVVSGGSASPIHFVLGSGQAISGNVRVFESGLPLSVATVNLYKADGSLAGSKVTDGLGNYRFEGLIPGNYFALASHPSGTYTSVLYEGIDCSSGCDVTTGTAIAISTLDVTMIDFALSDGSCPYNADPTQPDSDGDGIVDLCEENPPSIDPEADVDPTATIGDGSAIKRGVSIAAEVHLGSNVLVDRGAAILGECLVGDRVSIGKNTTIVGGPDCYVGNDTFIAADVLIDANVHVGTNSTIDRLAIVGAGAVIGNEVTVGREAEIAPGISLCDGSEIERGDYVDSDVGCP